MASLDKFLLISFNILLSSPSTFFMFFFFSIFFYDPRSDTKDFRLVLDVSSFTHGELDEVVPLTKLVTTNRFQISLDYLGVL